MSTSRRKTLNVPRSTIVLGQAVELDFFRNGQTLSSELTAARDVGPLDPFTSRWRKWAYRVVTIHSWSGQVVLDYRLDEYGLQATEVLGSSQSPSTRYFFRVVTVLVVVVTVTSTTVVPSSSSLVVASVVR